MLIQYSGVRFPVGECHTHQVLFGDLFGLALGVWWCGGVFALFALVGWDGRHGAQTSLLGWRERRHYCFIIAVQLSLVLSIHAAIPKNGYLVQISTNDTRIHQTIQIATTTNMETYTL